MAVLAAPAGAATKDQCCWWLTVKAKGKVVLTWPAADPFTSDEDKSGRYDGTYTREWEWTSVAIVDYELRTGSVLDSFDEESRALLDYDFHESSELCKWDRDFLREGGPFGCWPKRCDQRWATSGLVTYPETLAYFHKKGKTEYLGASAPATHYYKPRRAPQGDCDEDGRGPISSEAVHFDVAKGPWDYKRIPRPKPAKLLGKKGFDVKPEPWVGSHGQQEDTAENIRLHSSEAKSQIVFCFDYIAPEKIRTVADYLKKLADPKTPDRTKRLPRCEV
jgi:hypothetical protein